MNENTWIFIWTSLKQVICNVIVGFSLLFTPVNFGMLHSIDSLTYKCQPTPLSLLLRSYCVLHLLFHFSNFGVVIKKENRSYEMAIIGVALVPLHHVVLQCPNRFNNLGVNFRGSRN